VENLVPDWPGVHREEPEINFTPHDVDFHLDQEDAIRSWLIAAIDAEGYDLQRIDFIFCSDDFLLEINRTYLQHDDYTDIITFPMEENPILGEIYISIDRVKENAATYGISFSEELRRVMVHGILHLCGYDDHEDEDIEEMRNKEAKYLALLP
jgi:rRNA maturation RNase YbeY